MGLSFYYIRDIDYRGFNDSYYYCRLCLYNKLYIKKQSTLIVDCFLF